jgi:allantoicase
VAVADRHGVSDICEGLVQPDGHPVTPTTLFEIASLSKSVGSAFALEYFSARGISLDTKVNELLRRSGSPVRLQSSGDPSWAEEVSLTHLMSHSAMNMHYVKGVDRRRPMPRAIDFLASGAEHGYEPIQVVGKPGSRFRYSGGGFIVLEHLIEALEKRSIEDVTRQFLDRIAGTGLTFGQHPESSLAVAAGLFDHGQMVPGGRLNFPAFAAGALGSARGMITFLRHLQVAFKDLEGSGVISHDTAVCMLRGRDLGAREFMGCDMGLGVFVAEMGANRVAIHQGANEGFRAIYLHVVDGPDCGKGFVILCNADNRGVLFIAEVASVLFKHLKLSGLDMDKLGGAFDLKAFTQEQIVNAGYKQLLFSAFQPTLPGAIERHPGDKREPLWDRNLLGESLILSASNQRFARAENLVSPYAPVFDPMLYDPQGKVMDSWETSRHNDLPCDFLELRMKRPGQPRFVRLSTEFHDGNQAPFVRILGRSSQVDSWHELLPMTAMDGHSERLVSVANAGLIHDVRIEIHPDGGLSRVGLYEDIPEEWLPRFKNLAESTCARHAQPIPVPQKPLTIPYKSSSKDTAQYVANAPEIDWASAASGATVLLATNEHYGPAAQVISPFPAIHMFDGLESARSRKPGHYEEVVIRLGKEVTPGRIVFDFQHFVNNNPRFVQVFGKKDGDWRELTPPIAVKAFAGNLKEVRLEAAFKTGEILVRTLPDGGINRLHVFQAKAGD